MTALPIVLGADNPTLRTKTKLVGKVTKEIKKLIKDMQETVKVADGAGIAAPQIGQSLRLCLANINGKMTPLIDPKIIKKSDDTIVAEEGCLSLPGLWVDVPRSSAITLTYLDENGREQERHLEEWDARVVQHEVDHLEGVLIVDYGPQHAISLEPGPDTKAESI